MLSSIACSVVLGSSLVLFVFILSLLEFILLETFSLLATLLFSIGLLSDQSATITIEEGKYHQVKRMIGAAGGTVTYLKRLTIGHIDLCGIEEVGSVKDLSIEDVEGFKK